jgi:hypothetical protein
MNQDMTDDLEKAHHDESQWGDPVPPPVPTSKIKRKRLDAMVSIRLTPEELVKLQLRAANASLSLSSYLRWIAVTGADQAGIENNRSGDALLNPNRSVSSTPAIYSSTVFKVQQETVPTFAILNLAS